MIEFFRRLFAPERSSETAKERLKLVLLSDHLSLAPDVVEALKRDLLEVISRYVEIDPAHADVTFEQRDREVAMLASIPITGMRERVRPAAAVAVLPREAEAAAVVPEAVEERGGGDTTAAEEQTATSHAESAAASVPIAPATTTRRRRRRRKAAVAQRTLPAHGITGFDPA